MSCGTIFDDMIMNYLLGIHQSYTVFGDWAPLLFLLQKLESGQSMKERVVALKRIVGLENCLPKCIKWGTYSSGCCKEKRIGKGSRSGGVMVNDMD